MIKPRRKHEIEPIPSINVTNMIDIMLTLLLFFMLTSGLSKPNQIELNLPESTSGVKAQDEQGLVVAYRISNGAPEVTVNSRSVGIEKLGDTMRGLASPGETTRVDIRIDKSVPYQQVISLMDTVRDAGFPKFSLQTLASGSR